MTEDDRTRARSAIVEVAARLLDDHGAAALTTRAVAEAAGVQPPALYRLFGDKDGLLEAVAEHVLAGFVATKEAQAAREGADGADPVEDLHRSWMRQVDFGVAHPDLHRLLSDPERARRSPSVRAGREVLVARVRRIAAAGRLAVSEERAVAMVQAAGNGTILVLLATPPGERDAELSGLAEAMYRAVADQVLTEATARPADAPGAAAVTLRAALPDLDRLSDGERQLMGEWLDRLRR